MSVSSMTKDDSKTLAQCQRQDLAALILHVHSARNLHKANGMLYRVGGRH